MSSNIAIEVKDVSKSFQVYERPIDRLKQLLIPRIKNCFGMQSTLYYRDFSALRGVSFSINKGETVGIVGRNGSGKSTILQIICGTLSANTGVVATCGRIAALLELGSGFNPEFTGRENVYMNAAILGLSREETKKKFPAIEQFADIGDFIDQPVKTYSSGMVVRLAFAVSINVDPEILIVDEALAVGDELFQRKCFSRIEEIKKQGATILFVSHSGSTIIELCDRAILMDNGEQIAIGSPKEIVNSYQKLLYAPEDKKFEIRNEIMGLLSSKGNVLHELEINVSHEEVDRKREFFDPNLVPESTIEYESHGAIISKPRILTMEGEYVNNLVRGCRYKFKYQVDFNSKFDNVRFGMLIKSLSGVELGGAISAPSNKSITVTNVDKPIEVEFEFQCSLNPGAYFLNSGVLGNVDGVETYLHRLIDVAMFRVVPELELISTCIVDFNCTPRIIVD
ncbi:Teichoic acid export ATP-binding protein TagH [Vibrio chagasii]|nr:Teichoic acid export ATP-binding protein TagH [Vibrio chagasii]CAH6943481.1 Teichoic acid export ATP-binding protein TagH [Vibrio chagasii]CAH7397191.1 Teichoic acid export ATP-binding protein TagH [Vibrio chagasii]CAH7417297.1 Teichoic acid export ATP-binding protein TagH [Vibrio chagasii]CAH7422954.1 Teichoic acid export ATP-binding protein TagH [Vibrio chagasii]